MSNLPRQVGIKSLEKLGGAEQWVTLVENKIAELSNNETEYTTLIFQVVGDFLEGKTLEEIQDIVDKSLLGRNHAMYDDIRFDLEEHDSFIVAPFEVEEGVLECKCGSKKVFSFSKQVRSSDEPMTTFAECMKCGTKWKYSG